jgi:hypothetical protein
MSDPVLTVVCMLGSRRERIPRLAAAMTAQTAADRMEILLLDAGRDGLEPPLNGLPWRRLVWKPEVSLGEAKATGVREAKGEIVAFLLDHCYPDPGWAQALIAAYRERSWGAVGYGIRNANPGGYASDATFLAHFGSWEGTKRGEVPRLPGWEVSYRRSELLAVDDDLGDLLEIDATIHRRIMSSGQRLALEPKATAAEECFESVRDAFRANEAYARVLAVRRAKAEGWSLVHRLLRGISAPLLAPSIRLMRIWRGSTRDPRRIIRCMPGVLAICIGWALGEVRGYLFGEGGAGRQVIYWELEATRARG